MARDYAARCPVYPVRNAWLVAVAVLLAAQEIGAPKVQVAEELEAYPTESVELSCQFNDGGGLTKLTQVSWIWEPSDGHRDNIAVYHPVYGQSFPNVAFKDRVVFLHNSLENPSIRISNLRMSDAGRYTCEYATYPTGNEQGTTTLIMLSKPKNSANGVTVQAGTKSVVVARCEAADAKPAATIEWLAPVGGNHSTSTTSGPDGTVTVRSEYRLVPTPADNGREVICRVNQKTQKQPWVYPIKLSVEYLPSVSIEGYDHNWYVGRSDATLVCLANANPEPTTITWTAASGPLPETVVVEGNKLTVRKVDDAVNTTFICEVKNRLGSSRHQITTVVIGLAFVRLQRETEKERDGRKKQSQLASSYGTRKKSENN
uniref:Nectin cell adhesion molecule 3 n=1 Tax=Oreochromis niloticus TaxID=8128 RepID=A0A669CAG3_ORENI